MALDTPKHQQQQQQQLLTPHAPTSLSPPADLHSNLGSLLEAQNDVLDEHLQASRGLLADGEATFLSRFHIRVGAGLCCWDASC